MLGFHGGLVVLMDLPQASVPDLRAAAPGPIRVGVAGGGARAALLLGMLHGIEGATVVAVLAEDASGPAARMADDLGVFLTRDSSVFANLESMDVVVDASDSASLVEGAQDSFKPHVEIAGGAACGLLLGMFEARRTGEDQQKTAGELEAALDRSRSHERQLSISKAVLEESNTELQTQLSEMFFAHEFYRALARYTAIDDVCSLVVDGLTGLLGSEISCVYLHNPDDRTLCLRACQGLSHEVFRPVVSDRETILGDAFREGATQTSDLAPGSRASGWVDASVEIRSQAAVPLTVGRDVIGVILVASTSHRELSDAEMRRLKTLADQAAVSLYNALRLAEVERRSVTDQLTQLHDDRSFRSRIQKEVNRSGRFGHQLSLLLFRLDEHGPCEDSSDRAREDDLLREVASVVRRSLRDMDLAGRCEGDMLAVMLPETDLQGAMRVAERIRVGVESQTILVGDSCTVTCTASVGAATFPDHAPTAARLFEAAERGMRSARQAGGNRVELAEG
jgi:two-component system, cell cycle response regulator